MNQAADFPYESNYLSINGNRLHYIDEGQGQTLLFLHGMPTWSYLWRKMIPQLSQHYRVICVDLIGFGLSDKPDIEYRIDEHIDYIEQFVTALKLESFVMVMHGWGSVVGCPVAVKQLDNLAGLVFIESHLRARDDISKISLPVQELFYSFEQAGDMSQQVLESNSVLETLMLSGLIGQLSDEEMAQYTRPLDPDAP